MRRSKPIDALLPGIRQAVLAATLMNPDRAWYLTDLARHLRLRPSSLQRDLAALAAAGILRRSRDGNRVYFQADPDCAILAELTGIMAKSAGLVDVFGDWLAPLASQIDFAFVQGSHAGSGAPAPVGMHLMVVGNVTRERVAPVLRQVEQSLGREINLTVYSRHQFERDLQSRDPSLVRALGQERIFVVGSERQLGLLTSEPGLARLEGSNSAPGWRNW